MCSETKLLCAVLDNHLSGNRHIEMIYKKVYSEIGVLYRPRVSKFISRPILIFRLSESFRRIECTYAASEK